MVVQCSLCLVDLVMAMWACIEVVLNQFCGRDGQKLAGIVAPIEMLGRC